MAAIRASGGLGEVFELPVMMVVPGAVLGTIGGVVGATIKRLRSRRITVSVSHFHHGLLVHTRA